MYKEMINLFTDKSTSSLYVTGQVMALARKIGSGVSVWHGDQETLGAQVGRLAGIMKLMRDRGSKPSRVVLFHGLDPYVCPEIREILQADPDTVIQRVDAALPAENLFKLMAALSFMPEEDLSCLLAVVLPTQQPVCHPKKGVVACRD